MRQRYKGEDVKSRLHHTIIRYKGVPYLAEVMPEGIIGLRNIVTGNLDLNVASDDELIDISSISIGYVNVADENRCAVYLKRDPLRRYKQGVEIDYLRQMPLRKGSSQINRNSILMHGFVDAVANRFPSYLDAIKKMTSKDSWHSVALSRDIAIQRDVDIFKVFVKDKEVGYMKAGSHIVNVVKDDVSYCYTHILKTIHGWEVTEGK
jgi:hypothetical protein